MYDPFKLSTDEVFPQKEGGPKEPWNQREIPLHANQVKHERLPYLNEVSEAGNPLTVTHKMERTYVENGFKWQSRENKNRGWGGLPKFGL